MIQFSCRVCGGSHFGYPSLDAEEPYPVAGMTAVEREERCVSTSDAFIVDRAEFYVRGCLEIPVRDLTEPFSWGVWVSLSKSSFVTFLDNYDVPRWSHIGPFFGWLASALPYQPHTLALKTAVHLRDDGIRPFIELEPTDHPLAVEQREGITAARLGEIYSTCAHGSGMECSPSKPPCRAGRRHPPR